MDDTLTRGDRLGGRWDACIGRLQALRASVGSPSYAEIGNRIAAKRQAQGANPHAARVARSSVFDAFRMGRPRINVPFLKEIVEALGSDPDVVDEWVSACHLDSPVAVAEPEATRADSRAVLLLMGACLLLNLVGRFVVDSLSLTIYLDMMGTAVASIALGPWRGAAVGIATNLVGIAISGMDSLPFTLVNVAGAVTWGCGVRRWGWGRSLPRFFLLNVLTAWLCSAVSVPILLLMFGDSTPLGDDTITRVVVAPIHTYWLALSASNLLTSTMDKLLSGFVALVAVSALPPRLRPGVELVGVDPAATARPWG